MCLTSADYFVLGAGYARVEEWIMTGNCYIIIGFILGIYGDN